MSYSNKAIKENPRLIKEKLNYHLKKQENYYKNLENFGFYNDIKQGLSHYPKQISSKYFYDDRGSFLFSQIMDLPEYYLTNCEDEIFTKQSKEIICSMAIKEKSCCVIDIGAGNGFKSKKLLQSMLHADYQISYCPIDISDSCIKNLRKEINQTFPQIDYRGQAGDYFNILERICFKQKKVLLYLGSNLGNMTDYQAIDFLSYLNSFMDSGDFLILGLDMQKPADIILPAYNDSQGITAEFNLNLLRHLNQKLNANFDVENFSHFPSYDEKNGIAYSYIKSEIKQTIDFKPNDLEPFEINFDDRELIHTEISKKYSHDLVKKLCETTQFKIQHVFTDSKNYFCNYLLKK